MLTSLLSQCPSSPSPSPIRLKSPSSQMSLPSTSCGVSLPILLTPSSSLLVLNNPVSLPVSWLLGVPLDLGLTLFNPVYNIQAESSCIKVVC